MEGDESIEFSARWKDWVVIKRTTIREGTKPEEIVFTLAAIRQSIDRKAFDFIGIDTKALDDYAASISAGMKKNFKDLGQVVQALGTPQSKEAVAKACASKPEADEIARTYLFRKAVQSLGFDFDVNQEMLSKIYPELKMPKPRGRTPKK